MQVYHAYRCDSDGARFAGVPPSMLVFQDAGYRVLEAATVRDGLALLRRGERIGIVVTDYGLPDGTGEARGVRTAIGGVDECGIVEKTATLTFKLTPNP